MDTKLEKRDTSDETERILSNPVNAKHLEESIKQAEEGKVTSIKIEDLWK